MISIVDGTLGSRSIDHSIPQSLVFVDEVVHCAIVTEAVESNTVIAEGSVNVPPLIAPQSEVIVTVTVTVGLQ